MSVQKWILPLALFVCAHWLTPNAVAAEYLCDTSYESCRQRVWNLINAETVRIDVAFWFMSDGSYVSLLANKMKAGVPVRILMDSEAVAAHPDSGPVLAKLQAAGLPMRERTANGILHWKFMLFAGQNVVEFSGANYGAEYFPYVPYVNYIDEVIYFCDDSKVVNSFKTKFDDSWTDTTAFKNYANIAAPLTRAYPTFPIDPELNFLPTTDWRENYGNRLMALMNKEMLRMDVNMFRITNAAITDTAIKAQQRGVPIRFITDKSEYRNPDRVWHSYNVDRMFMAGVPLKIPIHQGINHEKAVMLYGQSLTVFGSSNWTTPSFNTQQEHNYFTAKPWFLAWFKQHFDRKWNAGAEDAAFIPQGPSSPSMLLPANAALSQPLTVTLSWQGGSWAHKYDIYFGTSSTPPLLAADVTIGSPDPNVKENYKVTGLMPGVRYYWRITGKTMANLTAKGPLWSFTTSATPRPVGASSIVGATPATGPATGGTAVTITGTNFAPGSTVSFGLVPATKVVVVNPTTITCVTPMHAAGNAEVMVLGPAGDVARLPNGFNFVAPPAPSNAPRINLVHPGMGTQNGGTIVTITGINFKSGLQVLFGGLPATVNSVSSVAVFVTTPTNAAGPVDVVVVNPDQKSSLARGAFVYQ
jgi:phosphatidylserine/phosphatidylglycerophosphate/cardiolipin synthase-like enzyme